MERLTKRSEDGIHAYFPECFNRPCDGIGCDEKKLKTCDLMDRVCAKLATYEDAEEQGQLAWLPCKVGDTVYEVNLPDELAEVCVYEVQDISTKEIMFCDDWYPLSVLGKTVFLTREAAEQALKERRSHD